MKRNGTMKDIQKYLLIKLNVVIADYALKVVRFYILKPSSDAVMQDFSSPCIHCLNCVIACKRGAIRLQGDLEKGRKFMLNNIYTRGNKEFPESSIY